MTVSPNLLLTEDGQRELAGHGVGEYHVELPARSGSYRETLLRNALAVTSASPAGTKLWRHFTLLAERVASADEKTPAA